MYKSRPSELTRLEAWKAHKSQGSPSKPKWRIKRLRPAIRIQSTPSSIYPTCINEIAAAEPLSTIPHESHPSEMSHPPTLSHDCHNPLPSPPIAPIHLPTPTNEISSNIHRSYLHYPSSPPTIDHLHPSSSQLPEQFKHKPWGTQHPQFQTIVQDRIKWSAQEVLYLEKWWKKMSYVKEKRASRCLRYIHMDKEAVPIFHRNHILKSTRLQNGFDNLDKKLLVNDCVCLCDIFDCEYYGM